MAEERARHLEQLRKAYESGALDEGTYRAAAAALGGTADLHATVEGSGAAAQAGGTAAGAGGVAVGGDVQGSIYLGPPTRDPAEALRIYRRVLVSTCCHLPLRGVDLGASDPTGAGQRLGLAQVYVDLDTKTPTPLSEQEKEERAAPALPGSAPPGTRRAKPAPCAPWRPRPRNRRLVLLGDPGSGKSTFLGHLALCLAAHGLEPQAGWLERLPGWPQEKRAATPILVTLRDFARWLPDQETRADTAPPVGLYRQPPGGAKPVLCRRSAGARPWRPGRRSSCWMGWTRSPRARSAPLCATRWTVFARRYPRSRTLVTCRTLSYQDPAWRLEDFPAFELAPFDEAKIDRFIEAWYAELSRLGAAPAGDAEGLAARLREAVRRPDLWRLAPNPLLLTVMALVHTHKGRLPDARALLYEDTVDILLWRWEQIKAGGDEGAPRLAAAAARRRAHRRGPEARPVAAGLRGARPGRRGGRRRGRGRAGRHRRAPTAQGPGRAASHREPGLGAAGDRRRSSCAPGC